jgi:hypothetical protein
MPKVIQPPGGAPTKPANTTLVQIGFQYALNYGFVSQNSVTEQQIFTYTPPGIAYDLGLDESEVKMQSLQPYDTSKTNGWITTLALFYIPSDMVNQLAVDIHTPGAGLYNTPYGTVNQLTRLIVPSIPLLAGQTYDGGTAPAASAATASPGAAGGGAPFGGDAGNGTPVNASAAAIAAPIATGGLLYGAAMVFVARRYRKKRQGHARSSSVGASSSFSGSPAWMSGARGARTSHGSGSSQTRSIRTQQISAPVMAENSLGWN